jgi:hypothetical protein
MQDPSHAMLISLSEEELADWQILRGVRVTRHNGRFWFVKPPGFYHALHRMARMTAEEAKRPPGFCWGCRVTLCDSDAEAANATMPMHVLANPEGFSLESLSSRRRNKVRNCLKRVQMVAIDKPDLLLEQGYEVALSAWLRTRYGEVSSPEKYRWDVERFFSQKKGLVLGGLVEGKLGGYLTSFAVGPTAYIESINLATEYLSTNISTGLFFEWMKICQKSKNIREVVNGIHTPENPTLCQYKEGLGFSVVHVPARIWFAPLAGALIKRLRPLAYYRLTGKPIQSH